MRIVYNIFISSHAPLSGVINNCVRPLHRAVHHAVYRGQRAVHECGPLRRGVRRNVSIIVFPSTSPGSDSIWIIQNMMAKSRSISRSIVLVTPVLLYLYWLYGLLVGWAVLNQGLLWVHYLSITNNMGNYFQVYKITISFSTLSS